MDRGGDAGGGTETSERIVASKKKLWDCGHLSVFLSYIGNLPRSFRFRNTNETKLARKLFRDYFLRENSCFSLSFPFRLQNFFFFNVKVTPWYLSSVSGNLRTNLYLRILKQKHAFCSSWLETIWMILRLQRICAFFFYLWKPKSVNRITLKWW